MIGYYDKMDVTESMEEATPEEESKGGRTYKSKDVIFSHCQQ